MLETKLTTCANLLYQWLLPRVTDGQKFKVDLQDFQAWTAEYREKPYSDREILDALTQLKELQLIGVSRTELTLEVRAAFEPLSNNIPLSMQMLLVESDRASATISARPHRLYLLLRIILGSLLLGLTSITLGLALVRVQPHVLTTSHPWSVLGDKNIDTSN